MEPMERICACLPKELAGRARQRAERLTELRLRPGGRPRLCFADGDELLADALSPAAFEETLARMLEFSVYAWEDEMRRGFFTLPGGSRVGVCGRFAVEDGRLGAVSYISAVCVRVAREVRGAGSALASRHARRRRDQKRAAALAPRHGQDDASARRRAASVERGQERGAGGRARRAGRVPRGAFRRWMWASART